MKRIIILISVIILFANIFTLPISSVSTFTEPKIKVFINNNEVLFTDISPQIINDRVMVPARAVFESLNAEVSWNEKTSEVIIKKNGEFIKLTINSNIMIIGICRTNGTGDLLQTNTITIDVPAQIINDRTMIPLRAVAEALKIKVDWDEKTRSVKIDDYSSVKADGWIYYASWSENGKLYKIDTNGQHRQKLSDYKCGDIRYIDGYLYYVRDNNSKYTYRMDVNGKGDRKISDAWIHFIGVYDDKIYYANLDESDDEFPLYDGKLYRMDMNCENVVKLTEDDVFYPVFYEGWIYYGNEKENGAIYKVDINGKNKTRVSPEGLKLYSGALFDFIDGWFYLENDLFADIIYRVSINGEVQKLTEGHYLSIDKITNEYIYFSDDFQLYRMDLDGKNRKLIAEGNLISMDKYNSTDEWIYYKDLRDSEYGMAIYRVDYNGENKSLIYHGGDVSIHTIIDDKLYVTDYGDIGWNENGGKLYKMDLDGNNPRLLCEYTINYIVFFDDWIYFGNSDDGHQYYKMDLDGNNITRVTYESTWHVTMVSN